MTRVRHGAALLFLALIFALLTILFTWPLGPLSVHGAQGVVGEAGDNLSFVWNFWWTRTAALGHQSVFWTPELFAPIGASLAAHTLVPLMSVGAAWLFPATAPVTLYNGALLLAVFLNFVCAYGAAYSLTRRALASVFAAVTFGASPFLIVRLAGHLNVLSAWGLPLSLTAVLRYQRKPTMVRAAVLACALALLAYTDYYYLIFAAAVAALSLVLSEWAISIRTTKLTPARTRWLTAIASLASVVVVAIALIGATGGADTTVAGIRIRLTETFNARVILGFLVVAGLLLWKWPRLHIARRRVHRTPSVWHFVPVTIGLLIVFLIPLILAAARLWQSGDYASQPYVWRNAPPGIDLATLLLGNQLHPITGSWTTGVYQRFGINAIEGSAWLGFAPLVLLVLAIKRLRSQADVQAALWIGGLFFIWSLGPYLRVLGYNTGAMLPQTVVRYVPIAANARIPGRAFVVVQLMVALLGASALASLSTSLERGATLIASVAIAAVLVDYYPAPRRWVALETPALYDTLKTLPPGNVLEIPLGFRDGFGARGNLDHRVLFYQTVHEHPQLGGFVARLSKRTEALYESDPIIGSILDLSEGRAEPAATPAACTASLACATRYVVVDESQASNVLQTFVARAFALAPVGRDGSRVLYTVEGLPGCRCSLQ